MSEDKKNPAMDAIEWLEIARAIVAQGKASSLEDALERLGNGEIITIRAAVNSNGWYFQHTKRDE